MSNRGDSGQYFIFLELLMHVAEIVARIEETAPLQYAAGWDKSGLQIASARKDASKIAVFLDPSPANIGEAISLGAEFLLSHHPLSISPSLPNKLDAYHEALRLALGADVPLYAAHTSLDVNLPGPAGWLGRELGLENARPLETVDASAGFGYGEVGDLSAPLPFEMLVNWVLRFCSSESAILCGPERKEVRRLAFCGGSGASLLGEACKAGADIFITGDVKYHTALEAAIPLLDIGHHAYEEEMMRRFAESLRKSLGDVEVIFLPSSSPFSIWRLEKDASIY